MTARAISTLVRPDAAHIAKREAFARTQTYVLREWHSGLPVFFGEDLFRLVFEWHADTRRSWKDWADAQVATAQPANMHPPKLRVGRRLAPLWINQCAQQCDWIPTLEIHAGDFELALHAIQHGDGTAPDLARCRAALTNALEATQKLAGQAA